MEETEHPVDRKIYLTPEAQEEQVATMAVQELPQQDMISRWQEDLQVQEDAVALAVEAVTDPIVQQDVFLARPRAVQLLRDRTEETEQQELPEQPGPQEVLLADILLLELQEEMEETEPMAAVAVAVVQAEE